MGKRETRGYLLSRISVSVRLLTSIASIQQRLDYYPHIRKIGDGDILRYVLELDDKDRFYSLLLSEDKMVLELYSKVSPLYFLREALLRIISIAALLSEDYEFDIRSLFPYLVDVLSIQAPKPWMEKLATETPEASGDIILAKRINSLSRQNLQLSKEVADSKSKFLKVTALVIIGRYGPNINTEDISKEMGIDAKDMETVLKAVQDMGYKAVPQGYGRYNLVRL